MVPTPWSRSSESRRRSHPVPRVSCRSLFIRSDRSKGGSEVPYSPGALLSGALKWGITCHLSVLFEPCFLPGFNFNSPMIDSALTKANGNVERKRQIGEVKTENKRAPLSKGGGALCLDRRCLAQREVHELPLILRVCIPKPPVGAWNQGQYWILHTLGFFPALIYPW